MKRIIIAALLLISIGANAQLNIVDRLRVKTSIQLGARTVTGISDDTTGTTLSANNLITERAAKLLITSRLSGFTGGSSSWASITGKPTTLSGYGITDNITTQGNTFNGANQLLQLNSSGLVPVARLASIPNSSLANSSITVNGNAVSLGGSVTIVAGFEPLDDTVVTASYTVQLRDLGRVIRVNSSSSVTITIPTGIAPSKFNKLTDLNFYQIGTGQITFAAGAGMTMNSLFNSNKSFAQHAGVSVHFETSTSFNLSGALTQ